MKKILALALGMAVAATPVLACLNYYGIDEHGRVHNYENYPPSYIFIHPKEDVKELKEISKWIDDVEPAKQYEYMSDYAAQLIKLGCNKEALDILRRLVARHPGEYRINANIAVAYELDGNLDSAIYYQKIALAKYPHSHYNSEWFHLQILEAAIALRDNKVSYDSLTIFHFPGKGDTVAYQIAHQLKERVPLTKSTNRLLSKVLEESADFYRAEISVQWAVELYAMAVGYAADEVAEARLWRKIKSARAVLKDLGKLEPKHRDLNLQSPEWVTNVQKLANKWRGYTPYTYKGKIRGFNL